MFSKENPTLKELLTVFVQGLFLICLTIGIIKWIS